MFIKSTKLKFKVEFCQVGLQGIVPLVEYPVWMLVVFTWLFMLDEKLGRFKIPTSETFGARISKNVGIACNHAYKNAQASE